MPKIIFTSRYIKNPVLSNAGKLIKYMGTREGVEKLPNGIDNSPATKNQNDLICTALKTVPEAWDYPEMKSYLENKTKANATEFLDEFFERNADRIVTIKNINAVREFVASTTIAPCSFSTTFFILFDITFTHRTFKICFNKYFYSATKVILLFFAYCSAYEPAGA